MISRILTSLFPLCFLLVGMIYPAGGSSRWWPIQKVPKGVVCTPNLAELERVDSPGGRFTAGHLGATHMLVQSIAGLAAQAVNEGRLDEMVWIGTDNLPSYEEWYKRTIRQWDIEERGTFSPWQLVERYKKKGVIKGYVLYSYDYSEGDVYAERQSVDESVNVATSLAGLLEGILVEEGQEAKAKATGLNMLFDARGKTQEWCFENYRDRLNRKVLCTQDTKVPHCRALAIAHHCFVFYGMNDLTSKAMEWLEPLSPILGWNCGDEFEQTVIPSEYGHFQTATNWCLNLPFLMAGSEKREFPQFDRVSPEEIEWKDAGNATSFVMTDGDNVQWLMGSFFHLDSYWANPLHGEFPFGWTSCFSQLTQLCPAAVEYAVETQPEQVSLVEFGGGYYYPDRFGKRRKDKDLLAKHARRVWENMQKCGVRILSVNCRDLSSKEAQKAFQTYAEEMGGLVGIIAIQYAPYEGGAGKIFWVKKKDGTEIPVVTARYSIWANANHLGERIGTPARIARKINANIEQASDKEKVSLDWTIVHCWSYFQKAPGDDIDAENMDQAEAPQRGGVRGVEPVAWCIERLTPQVETVSIEELLWRLRMRDRPEETRKLIE